MSDEDECKCWIIEGYGIEGICRKCHEDIISDFKDKHNIYT